MKNIRPIKRRFIPAILVMYGLLAIIFMNWVLKLYGGAAFLLVFISRYFNKRAESDFWTNVIVYYLLFGLGLSIAMSSENGWYFTIV